MRGVMQRLSLLPQSAPVKTAEPTAQSELQPILTDEKPPEGILKKAIKACLEAGLSDSKIVKDVIGCKGSSFNAGMETLKKIKGDIGK
jgi:hypothetical protein